MWAFRGGHTKAPAKGSSSTDGRRSRTFRRGLGGFVLGFPASTFASSSALNSGSPKRLPLPGNPPFDSQEVAGVAEAPCVDAVRAIDELQIGY